MNVSRRSRSTLVIRYRRSPALVLYWSGRQLICFDPRRQRRFPISSEVADCLGALDTWTTADAFARRFGARGITKPFERLLRSLAANGLVETGPEHKEWPWQTWSPEASFFFFGTRGGAYPADPRRYDATLRRKAKHDPPPDPIKSIAGPRVPLPQPQELGSLSTALRERRTWRHFGDEAVALVDLSTLLQLTWGIQKWGVVKGQGRIPLKTSPSGGARHAIEAYVLARNVAGLPASAYHYDAGAHALVRLGGRITSAVITRLLVNQFYYGKAAALVVMCAVFPRAMWRYPFNRALRTVFAEAGHLGQTFCLAATSLRLAPFTVMAFDEAQAERLTRVDGVSECPLYVVGVGARSPRHAAQPGRITRGDHP